MRELAQPAARTLPTIGRIVIYVLTASNAKAINRWREDARQHLDQHRANANGVQLHVGTECRQGEWVPLIITRVWSPDCVNGSLVLDGNDTLFVTSSLRGDDDGCWFWPPRI